MLLPLYRSLTAVGAPVISAYLRRRLVLGKEDPVRFDERRGVASADRPAGSLIWMHGASVGESLSLLPLMDAILDNHVSTNILLTTGTVTSAQMLVERLPDRAIHQFVPVDRSPYVSRFLDHWRPNLVLWSESEFWPNLVSLPAERGIPMVLVNGRVSERSYRSWRRWPGLIGRILSGFDLCLAQGTSDEHRLRALGAERVSTAGNLKFAAPPLSADGSHLTAATAALQGRPRWLAASTHPGEEDMCWRVHQQLKVQNPDLVTIIVPRHPDRGGEITASLTAAGARVVRRSTGELPDHETDIYLADTLGELGLFFRLCKIVFMGKSLVDLGGQNPIEPARLECAVLFGPHMSNFPDIAGRMIEGDAALRVADTDDLARSVGRLLGDESTCDNLGRRALAFAETESDVLGRVMVELGPHLSKLGSKDHNS